MSAYDPPETIDEILEREKLGYIEQQNPIRDDERKDPFRAIKIELLGIIATYQDPVCCNRIFRDFFEINGYDLDPTKYGFRSFSGMMRTFSDKFYAHNDGVKTTYTAKKSERSAHLQELIANQVTIEEKRRRDMQRSRSYSRPRRSNYGAGVFYAQNFVPVEDDGRTKEEREAANLHSFGRSLAAASGLDWGGRKSRADDSTASSSDDDDDAGGMVVRSKSVPPSRSPMPHQNGERGMPMAVHDDPKGANLDQCTNPFRVQNNVRIRDIVIRDGEMDGEGRKGLALMEVAAKFRKEHRLPLGGIPNTPEDRLMTKMSAVETVEWEVERMGDGVAYVIVPAETLVKANQVGPGSPTATRDGQPIEKPKSPVCSPAAKRMLGHTLKECLSVNSRQRDTRERNLAEREKKAKEDEEVEYEMGANSDGDPCMVEVPKGRKNEKEGGAVLDRDAIMALSTHAQLDRDLEWKVGAMRILRTPPRTSPQTSLLGMRGAAAKPPNGPSSRLTPPESSSSMWSSQPSSTNKPGPGFGSGSVPSFGTFKSTPPPAPPVDKEIDHSEVIQPSQSNLASKLPQMSFSSAPKMSTPSPSFPSSVRSGSGLPSFGTSSQSVPAAPTAAPRTAPSFGGSSTTASSSPAQPSFPSAFGGSQTSTTRTMVEVIGSQSNRAEVLGATIQLIGKLRSGVRVSLQEIERTPVEDVVVDNGDFFDIDEKERIHLLHKDVKPELLLFDGQPLGEVVEKKEEAPEPTKEPRVGMFSKPPTFGGRLPPTFGGSTSAATEERPTFGARQAPTFGGMTTARPTLCDAPRDLPAFGSNLSRLAVQVVEGKKPVVTATPAVSRPIQNAPGMPSFGTKSGELVQRPDSAMSNRSNRSEEPKQIRQAPTFGGVAARPVERVEAERRDSTSSASTVDSRLESNYNTAPSALSSRNASETLEVQERKNEVVVEKEKEKEVVESGPYAFPDHSDIRRLGQKPSLLFDTVRKGQIRMASILTSFAPNRLLMTLVDEGMMENLHSIMRELGTSYVDKTPLGGGAVKLGQFAVAINGECIVRVVVLSQNPEDKTFECACLDINAVINVDGGSLYELIDRFGVHAKRAITFVARINGITDLLERGHKAVKLVAKGTPEDDSVKTSQPFIFHGKGAYGDLVVDVAALIGTDCVWMGEGFTSLMGVPRDHDAIMNPNLENAIELAVNNGVEGYAMPVKKVEKKKETAAVTAEVESDNDTPNEKDLLTMRSNSVEGLNRVTPSFSPVKRDEEKEDGELDSSLNDSTASERTTVEKHAAGVAVVREVKEEPEDEFVVVAPVGPKPVIDVESMTSLIHLFQEKGEHVEADVVKSMCRALILSINKTLSNLGERGALIVNAESLEEIEMA